MKFDFDSILNQNTGPKQNIPSASFGMLHDHWIVVSKPAFEAAFYRPKRLIRPLHSPFELNSAAASVAIRFSAKFSAK
jgi:hypothetical protein